MFKGRFPANDITWDNWNWAFNKGARWSVIWWLCQRWHRACRDLRRNIPMEEVV